MHLLALLATLLVAPQALTAPYQAWSLPGADEPLGDSLSELTL